MLGPVAFGEEQPVAAGVLHEGGHHVVVLAVLGAVLGELEGGAEAAGRTPQGTAGAEGERAWHLAGRADAAVVVAAFQVVPALQHQAGAGQAVAHRLRGDDDGGGHAAGGVHGELDVGQFRHVFQEPLGTELADAVQRVVGGIEGVDHVLGDGGVGVPVGAGGGYRHEDDAVNFAGVHAGVGDSLAAGHDALRADGGFDTAVPAAGGGRMADANGGDLAPMLPDSQALGGAVH